MPGRLTIAEAAELRALYELPALEPRDRKRFTDLAGRCFLYGQEGIEPRAFEGLEPRYSEGAGKPA